MRRKASWTGQGGEEWKPNGREGGGQPARKKEKKIYMNGRGSKHASPGAAREPGRGRPMEAAHRGREEMLIVGHPPQTKKKKN